MKHKIYKFQRPLLLLTFSFLLIFSAFAQDTRIAGKWLLQNAIVVPKTESNTTLSSSNCLLCALKETRKPLVISTTGNAQIELGSEGYKMKVETKGNQLTFIAENIIEVSGNQIPSGNQKVKSFTNYTYTLKGNTLTLSRADALYSETYTFTK